MKYYFREDDESCYVLESHFEYMRANDLTEMKVFEAVRLRGTGYFYCKEQLDTGEVGNCGKVCNDYKPRNGIKGICKHYGFVYDYGKEKILRL